MHRIFCAGREHSERTRFDFRTAVDDLPAMRWALRLGRIAGTEVRIHLTFFLLLAWLGAMGYQAGGLREGLHWALFMCLVFFCVLLHEFGHALAARRYGIRTPDITLFPFGGVARIERMPEKPGEEIVIALAGPAVNVVIAVGLWLALAMFGSPGRIGAMNPDGSIVELLVHVNVMLLLFNLIPAFPMDGGRVLRAVLAMRLGRNRATQIAAHIGQALAIGLGFVGVFGSTTLGMSQNPMLIIVAFFVFMAAANEAGAVQMQSVTRGLAVWDAMVTEFKTLPRNASLGEAADVLLHSSQHEFPVTDPDGTLRGIFTRSELVAALRASGPEAPVLEVMRDDFPIVHPRTPFDEAFKMMQQHGSTVLPVTDEEGRLVGLFTMENIGEMLMVRSAIAQSRRRG
jgi:Zn-dependent protease/CBS domain-containing protein